MKIEVNNEHYISISVNGGLLGISRTIGNEYTINFTGPDKGQMLMFVNEEGNIKSTLSGVPSKNNDGSGITEIELKAHTI